MTNLVLTLIGPDRPGLVEAVAEAVAAHGGNWLESRMAQLAGKFAGILRIEAPADRTEALTAALTQLAPLGLKIVVEVSGQEMPAAVRAMELDLVGLDRPGLVREISHLLASHAINVEELATDRWSAPMSGEMLFHAHAHVNVPATVDLSALRTQLERLAGNLMLEIQLADKKE